ncbi:hypothetical protein FHG87_023472 [Trinorchestia longiramus]|nr:hypothetical protein FHG87_023472 [Trinorchestia longiramus]
MIRPKLLAQFSSCTGRVFINDSLQFLRIESSRSVLFLNFQYNLIVNMNMSESFMDVVHKQYGENQWKARCIEMDSGVRYLVRLDEECNMTVVDAMKNFLVHAWSK